MGSNNVGQINYVNPAFKAEQAKTETISPQTKVTYTIKPDEFVKESKPDKTEDKKSMSFGAKAAAVVAGTALAVGAIYLAVRKGKFVLPEHIEFRPAKTIKEARKFARKQLGIKKFKVNDLEIANYVNEGLTNASNISKGKIVLPRAVEVRPVTNGIMAVNGKARNATLIINPELDCDVLKNTIVNIAEYKKLSFLDKLNALVEIRSIAKNGTLMDDKFHCLYHELGHLNHKSQSPQAYKSLDIPYIKSKADIVGKVENVTQQHVSSLLQKDILGYAKEKIGAYGCTYPNEFVAEVYGLMMSGKKLPKEVMDLYYQYGGPKIGVLVTK